MQRKVKHHRQALGAEASAAAMAFEALARSAGVSPARGLQLLVWDFVVAKAGILERVEHLERLARQTPPDFTLAPLLQDDVAVDPGAHLVDAAIWSTVAADESSRKLTQPARDDLPSDRPTQDGRTTDKDKKRAN